MFIHREGQTQNSIARFFLRNVGVDSGMIININSTLFNIIVFQCFPYFYRIIPQR